MFIIDDILIFIFKIFIILTVLLRYYFDK